MRCKKITKSGNRCKFNARTNSEYCGHHIEENGLEGKCPKCLGTGYLDPAGYPIDIGKKIPEFEFYDCDICNIVGIDNNVRYLIRYHNYDIPIDEVIRKINNNIILEYEKGDILRAIKGSEIRYSKIRDTFYSI